MGVIYLVRDDKFWKENIFKVGKTSNWEKRRNSYGKDIRVLEIFESQDINTDEREMIKAFSDKFEKARGEEYFLCSEKEAVLTFLIAKVAILFSRKGTYRMGNLTVENSTPNDENVSIEIFTSTPNKPEEKIPTKEVVSEFLGVFSTDECRQDERGWIPSSDIYEKFSLWCEKEGRVPILSSSLFEKELSEAFQKKKLVVDGKLAVVFKAHKNKWTPVEFVPSKETPVNPRSSIDLFLDELCVDDYEQKDGWMIGSDIYRGFVQWCQRGGYKNIPNQNVFGRSTNGFFEKKRLKVDGRLATVFKIHQGE